MSAFNLQAFKDQCDELKHTKDRAVFNLRSNKMFNQVNSVKSKITKIQTKIVNTYLPLLSLPNPDPVSIVKWLGKISTATSAPQLIAYIGYAEDLIMTAQALQALATMIEYQINNFDLEREAISLLQSQAGDIVSEIQQVQYDINGAMTAIGSMKTQFDSLTGSNVQIDTSSNDAFINSSSDAKTQIQDAQDALMASTPPVYTNNAKIVVSNTNITIDEGTWTGTEPFTFTYLWNVDGSETLTDKTIPYVSYTTISCTVACENIAGYANTIVSTVEVLP